MNNCHKSMNERVNIMTKLMNTPIVNDFTFSNGKKKLNNNMLN